MRLVIRGVLSAIGAGHLIVFALAFFTPAWFFAHIAPFPPFNGHFLADIGAFNAPLGVGLLLAAREPERYRAVIGLAALGNLLHASSHLRDMDLHLPPHMTLAAGLTQQALFLLPGVVLLLIAARGAPRDAARATTPVTAAERNGSGR